MEKMIPGISFEALVGSCLSFLDSTLNLQTTINLSCLSQSELGFLLLEWVRFKLINLSLKGCMKDKMNNYESTNPEETLNK